MHPVFNLYNKEWPIYTSHDPLPPAKFVHDSGGRVGQAVDSFVSSGAVISGAPGRALGPVAVGDASTPGPRSPAAC